MTQAVSAVAKVANDQISSILAHLNEQAPILPRNASATDIVIHRLRMVNICKEYGCTEYVIGPLPQNPDIVNTQLGKSFYLSAFEDPNLRGLVASKRQSGPECWTFVGNNMLGGRDEQEILSSILQDMMYDGSGNILAFYAHFVLLSNGVQHARSQAGLCAHYASKFSAKEFVTISSTCDANPGHSSFSAYAAAVNNGIQQFHQGRRIKDARMSRIPNMFGIWTRDIADVVIDGRDPGEFFYTPPTITFLNAEFAETDQIAKNIMPAVLPEVHAVIMEQRETQRGGGSKSTPRRPAHANMGKRLLLSSSASWATPTSLRATMTRNCTNCGQHGHASHHCPKPHATCTFPMCKNRGLTKHLTSECWFKHPTKCPQAFKAKRDKVVQEEG